MRKQFKFKDFNEAWSFMSDVALAADQLDHHPEWSNTYNNVEIILTTHDAGEITDLDIKLANKIDTIEKKYKQYKMMNSDYIQRGYFLWSHI